MVVGGGQTPDALVRWRFFEEEGGYLRVMLSSPGHCLKGAGVTLRGDGFEYSCTLVAVGAGYVAAELLIAREHGRRLDSTPCVNNVRFADGKVLTVDPVERA